MAYDNNRMQDITLAEKELLATYKSLWSTQDWAGIATLLTNNPQLKYKVFNAFNWNRLLDLTSDATSWSIEADRSIDTNATADSVAGKFASDFNAMLTASEDFIFVGDWQSGVTYKKNNLVAIDDYHLFYCIQDHTASSANIPTDTDGNQYWLLCKGFIGDLGTEGFQFSSTQPSTISAGDVWLQEIV